ncbi:MAG: hypothetical protein PUB26_00395 [Mycoplasmataceae bacterium]|nr:hypothetical protein [Mycoplasmataceae bacterium]
MIDPVILLHPLKAESPTDFNEEGNSIVPVNVVTFLKALGAIEVIVYDSPRNDIKLANLTFAPLIEPFDASNNLIHLFSRSIKHLILPLTLDLQSSLTKSLKSNS